VTESITDGLSVVGLVVGFPLLLLAFMISLEKLETWGLRDADPGAPDMSRTREAADAAIDAAIQDAERPTGGITDAGQSTTVSERASR
jgi:hypothetical protein